MNQLFLHGGTFATFAETTAGFVAAAGGGEARIGLLLTYGWEPFLERYSAPLLAHGAASVEVIAPRPGEQRLDPAAVARIGQCTGLYMGGGDTRIYHALFAQGEALAAIREAHGRGVPYGGLSAGAILATNDCTIWGDRLTTATNRLSLAGAEGKCDAELAMTEGLGLLPDCLVEPHFSESGGFARLVVSMEQRGVRYGLGIDEPICLEITGGRECAVTGQGRLYVLERQANQEIRVRAFEPGQRFTL